MREHRAALIRSSDTSPPAAMMDFVLRPSGVSAAISARNISPVEMEGIVFPNHSIMSRPCVPLPQPGGPNRRIIKDDCMASDIFQRFHAIKRIMRYVSSKWRQGPLRQIAKEEACAPPPLARDAQSAVEDTPFGPCGHLI